MPPTISKTLGVACLGVLMAMTGCASPSTTTPQESARRPASRHELRIQTQALVLGHAAARPMTPDQFAARALDLMSLSDPTLLGSLVHTYPDIAQAVVLSADASHQPCALAVAAWLDHLAAPQAGGWRLHVRDRQDQPRRHERFHQWQADAQEQIRHGRFHRVKPLKPSADELAPSPWLAVSASVLYANVKVMAGQMREAADHFAHAAQAAQPWDETIASHHRLQAAMARRLAGQEQDAIRLHTQAADALALDRLHDPTTLRLLLDAAGPPGSQAASGQTPRAILARLGELELRRGQPHAALAAWKQAEASPGPWPWAELLQVWQADALSLLGQHAAAQGQLIRLAQTRARPQALIRLALARVQAGMTEQGLAMARQAVHACEAQAHPDVHADAALVMLAAGQHEQGLHHLRLSRDAFVARHDLPNVWKTWRNEWHFAQSTNQTQRVQEIELALAQALIAQR